MQVQAQARNRRLHQEPWFEDLRILPQASSKRHSELLTKSCTTSKSLLESATSYNKTNDYGSASDPKWHTRNQKLCNRLSVIGYQLMAVSSFSSPSRFSFSTFARS